MEHLERPDVSEWVHFDPPEEPKEETEEKTEEDKN